MSRDRKFIVTVELTLSGGYPRPSIESVAGIMQGAIYKINGPPYFETKHVTGVQEVT